MDAKATQIKYGSSNQEDFLFISFTPKMIAKIESHNKIISTKAILVNFNSKNNTLHKIFKIKFIPKSNPTFFFCFLFFELVQAKYKEKVIKTNKTFQTTGKTQSGGVMEGFIEEYQRVFVFLDVNMLPIPPSKRNTIKKQNKKTILLYLLFFFNPFFILLSSSFK
jgi:hypothetical protein